MESQNKQALAGLQQVISNLKERIAQPKPITHRFDIFKGVTASDGKVIKLRSIGSAQLIEGTKTYTVYLKSLLKDVFYILPEEQKRTRGDYVILTRELSQNPNRKYFWNSIGEGFVLGRENPGVMRLSFDLFGDDDIYMSLHPMDKPEKLPPPLPQPNRQDVNEIQEAF